jgi:prepilin-type N-terminal cleavage/methylation domain-containing protein
MVHVARIKMKTTRTKPAGGFTLVEIMIVVAIVALLAAIAIPNLLKASARSQATTCINNLRQIDTAIQQFSIVVGKHLGDTITFPDDLTPYIKLNVQGSIPQCPAKGTYNVGIVGTNPSVTCSFSSLNPPHAL